MIMTNKKLIYIFLVIFNFYSSLVFGINLRLLDSNADFFNDRIWSKVDSSIILIQERLGFLDESDIVGYQQIGRAHV